MFSFAQLLGIVRATALHSRGNSFFIRGNSCGRAMDEEGNSWLGYETADRIVRTAVSAVAWEQLAGFRKMYLALKTAGWLMFC